MSAELAARRVAAAAVLADFRRNAEGTDTIGRALWADRLADMLMFVLFELDACERAREQEVTSPSGQLAEIRRILRDFAWETDNGHYVLEAITQVVGESAQ